MAQDTIHIIMSHGNAQKTFDRHRHTWEMLGLPIIVVCPSDSPVNTNHTVVKVGTRQHHGQAAIDRFVKILQIGMSSGYPFMLFNEYDSLCLELPFHLKTLKGIHGWDWRDENPANGFKGTHFIHPPLFMDIETAQQIVQASIALSCLGDEKGFWDRWVGMICEKQGIPIHSTEKFHFSRNTIEQHHIGGLAAALKAGAIWFHGVKTEAVYNMIMARHAKAS